MSIIVACQCGKRFRAKSEHAGKRAKCPGCGHILVISSQNRAVDTTRAGSGASDVCMKTPGAATVEDGAEDDPAAPHLSSDDLLHPKGREDRQRRLRTVASTLTIVSHVFILIIFAIVYSDYNARPDEFPALGVLRSLSVVGAPALGFTAWLLFRTAGHRPPTPPEWTLNPVGFWRRAAAQWIDGLVLLPGFVVLFLLLRGNVDVYGIFAANLVWGSVVWLYHGVLESSNWQATIGKRALGIYVVDKGGQRISFCRAGGRNLAEFLSVATFGLGYLIVAVTREREALHDMLAGTLVVGRGGLPPMPREGPGYCPRCQEQVLVRNKPLNHAFHLIVVLLTVGYWVPVWLLCWAFFTDWRCTRCGSRAKRKVPA